VTLPLLYFSNKVWCSGQICPVNLYSFIVQFIPLQIPPEFFLDRVDLHLHILEFFSYEGILCFLLLWYDEEGLTAPSQLILQAVLEVALKLCEELLESNLTSVLPGRLTTRDVGM
jgi:hypothetical protein